MAGIPIHNLLRWPRTKGIDCYLTFGSRAAGLESSADIVYPLFVEQAVKVSYVARTNE